MTSAQLRTRGLGSSRSLCGPGKRPLALEPLEDRRLLALEAQLLADVNLLGAGSNSNQYVPLGDFTYFASKDLEHGDSLWRTDGAMGNAQLVKDINPGAAGANIRGLFEFDGSLVFFADDGEHGNELWTSDGTAAGTRLLKDIESGPESSNSLQITMAELDGKLYFNAFDSEHGKELWATDGTSEGTALAADINPGTAESFPYALTVFDGKLLFSAKRDAEGQELWESDGTADGTHLLADINADGGSNPFWLKQVGDAVFFAATTTEFGRELWKTDGTTEGTERLSDMNPGPNNGFPQWFTDVDGVLIYEGNFQLWRSDGTVEGTYLVKPIDQPFGLTEYQGKAYFSADDFTNGREFWSSDGTEDGTQMVLDITPGPSQSLDFDPGLVVFDDQLVFRANALGVTGTELWTSDGTAEGTHILADINPGPASSADVATPKAAVIGDKLFFSADNGQTGAEPWTSDGTPEGSQLLQDINLGTKSSDPAAFFAVADQTAFTAMDAAHGRELWRTDGSAAGTALVKDINPGLGSLYPYQGTGRAFDGTLYFQATDGVNGNELWRSDLSEAGTVAASDTPIDLFPQPLSQLNGEFFFAGEAGTEVGFELWHSDGTTAGTAMVKDFFPGTSDYIGYGGYVYTFANSLFPEEIVNFAGKLFFSGNDEAGRELWSSDGTVDGTARVLDLLPGEGTSYYGNPILFGGNPNSLTVLGDMLFFVATSADFGRELWVTDGTEFGTHVVKDIVPGGGEPDNYGNVPSGSNPTKLTIADGKLFFFADDLVHGRELWVSDGTEDGTHLVRDVNEGVYPANTAYQAAPKVGEDGRLYFVANDGLHGFELWISDGTEQGTQLIRDINPGTTSGVDRYASVSSPVTVGNRLFVVANDGVHGQELWTSDGTELGTFLVEDILPGAASGIPSNGNLTEVNDALYFVADDGAHGREPWVISADQVDFLLGDTNNDRAVNMQDLANVRNYFGSSGFGDADGDDDVDISDLNAVRNNFGESRPSLNPGRPAGPRISPSSSPNPVDNAHALQAADGREARNSQQLEQDGFAPRVLSKALATSTVGRTPAERRAMALRRSTFAVPNDQINARSSAQQTDAALSTSNQSRAADALFSIWTGETAKLSTSKRRKA